MLPNRASKHAAGQASRSMERLLLVRIWFTWRFLEGSGQVDATSPGKAWHHVARALPLRVDCLA